MSNLAKQLCDLNEEQVYKIIDEMINEKISPEEIIRECNVGMVEVGDLFASGNYFLTELMFSAEIMKGVMEKLEPIIKSNGIRTKSSGTVVMGTIKDDIHDIGKNIVVSLLRSQGFTVVDLGVDVTRERFVTAIIETGAKVLGLSALLNSAYPEMKNVVDAITEAGLREQVIILIGGAIANESARVFSGADYFANNAITGVSICKKVYGII